MNTRNVGEFMPGTFDIDHLKMETGIYCPGEDSFDEVTVITLDVRVVLPYREKVLTIKELHTVEHILAVELEKACEKDSVVHKVYWGPMGCQTGFYLLVAVPRYNSNVPSKICSVLQEACRQVLLNPFYVTPANDIKKCGNCKTLYSTADEVKWILRRIYDSCERVVFNNEYDTYTYLES